MTTIREQVETHRPSSREWQRLAKAFRDMLKVGRVWMPAAIRGDDHDG